MSDHVLKTIVKCWIAGLCYAVMIAAAAAGRPIVALVMSFAGAIAGLYAGKGVIEVAFGIEKEHQISSSNVPRRP